MDYNFNSKTFDIRRKSLFEDLKKITDDDYNGTNGIEYVKEDALCLGFTSNLEYGLYLAKEIHNFDFEKTIKFILDDDYSDDYYWNYYYDVYKVNDGLAHVVVTYTSED